MADPLSVVASIIALVTAAQGTSMALLKLKNLCEGPSDILAFINELSDLGIVFGQVERYITHISHDPQSQVAQEQLDTLAGLVKRATDALLEANELIQHRPVRPGSTLHQTKVSRREWLRLKPKLKQVWKTLSTIRLNVVTHMVTLNS